jgi:hypothetical protein
MGRQYANFVQKRIVLGACNGTTGNMACALYALGYHYVYYVSSSEDNGAPGTLRTGINKINAFNFNAPKFYYIKFKSNVTITLTHDLPFISNSINFVGNNITTINLGGNSGLNIKTDYCSIKGITITNSNNSGIDVYGSYTIIENCIVTNNVGNGIYLAPGSKSNIVGTNTSLDSNYVSNILANNGKNGIEINGSNNNTLHKNYIGTINGTSASPNTLNGIYITNGSSNNIIGGKIFENSSGQINNPTGAEGKETAVYIIPPQGNLISGNSQNGILVDLNSTNNYFYGNFIGTTSSGNSALSNMLNGILIENAPNNSVIGCEVYNNPFVFYNVVSGNNENGIQITNSNNCVIQGNFMGITMNNQGLCPNQLDGLLVNGTSTNVQVGGVIPLGNVISGNNGNGIHVTGNVSGFISFNTFAGIFAFGGVAPNGLNGILVDGDANNSVIRTCVTSGNNGSGIELSGNSSYITVEDVICGTQTNSFTVLPNNNGLTISGNSNNNIIQSTTSVAYNNVYSGNTNNGIQLLDNSNNNAFYNCKVGVAIFGENMNTVSNGNNGVFLAGTTNNNIFTSIVADVRTLYNVISGNGNYGVYFNSSGPTNNSFTNNYIGVGRLGNLIPNISGNFGGTIDSTNTTTPNYT